MADIAKVLRAMELHLDWRSYGIQEMATEVGSRAHAILTGDTQTLLYAVATLGELGLRLDGSVPNDTLRLIDQVARIGGAEFYQAAADGPYERPLSYENLAQLAENMAARY